MGRRIDLHNKLCELLAAFGRNVYYQPPSSYRIAYPCIVYSLLNIETKFADNIPYAHQKQYSLTVIDNDPDSTIVDKVADLPGCSFDRPYMADNLYHWVFTIHY